MNDIDRKIKAALGSDADAISHDEANVATEAIAVFRHQQRWLTAGLVVVNLAAFVGVIISAMRFCQLTDVSQQLRWGGLAIVLLLIIALLKIWFWLEMHTNRVRRELKRVELLIVSQAHR